MTTPFKKKKNISREDIINNLRLLNRGGINKIFLGGFCRAKYSLQNFKGKYSLQQLKIILIVRMTKMIIEIIRMTKMIIEIIGMTQMTQMIIEMMIDMMMEIFSSFSYVLF